MKPGGPGGYSAAVWDIAVPSGPGRVPGVRMAGFRDRVPIPVEELRVVPYPAVTLMIDLRDGIVVGGQEHGQRHRGSIAAGLAAGTVFYTGGGNVDCLQIRLSPVTAHAVLADSAGLGGTVTALEDLLGPDASRLEERLRAAGSWPERFALAESVLGRRYEAGRAADPEVTFAWHRLAASQGQARVEEVADEIGWSRKRLWSRFRAQAGISPKQAASLIRFDGAVHRLASGVRAADVAAEAGYADQSHLHRDVMTFAGVTPTAAALAPWLMVDDVAWASAGNIRPGSIAGRR